MHSYFENIRSNHKEKNLASGSKKDMETILDHLEETISIVDKNDKCIYVSWSLARLLNVDRNSLYVTGILKQIMHPDDMSIVDNLQAKILASENERVSKVLVRLRTGSNHYLKVLLIIKYIFKNGNLDKVLTTYQKI